MQEQSALEVLHCVVAGEVKSHQSSMLSCIYAKLLSLSQELCQTKERVKFAECRTDALEHHCVEKFEHRTTALETSNQQLGDRTTELETANQRLGDRTTELETSNQRLGDRTTELETANQRLGDRTTELETANQRLGDRISVLETANQQLGDHTPKLETSNDPSSLEEQKPHMYVKNAVQKCTQDIKELENIMKSQFGQIYEKLATLETRIQKAEYSMSKMKSFAERLHRLELLLGH